MSLVYTKCRSVKSFVTRYNLIMSGMVYFDKNIWRYVNSCNVRNRWARRNFTFKISLTNVFVYTQNESTSASMACLLLLGETQEGVPVSKCSQWSVLCMEDWVLIGSADDSRNAFLVWPLKHRLLNLCVPIGWPENVEAILVKVKLVTLRHIS